MVCSSQTGALERARGVTDIAGMYHLLGQIAKDVRENNQILNEHSRILNEHSRILNEHSRVLNEHGQILNEHSRILGVHGRTLDDHGHKLGTLQESMNELRSSVQGNGILLCELEDRTRRIERYLELPPAAE